MLTTYNNAGGPRKKYLVNYQRTKLYLLLYLVFGLIMSSSLLAQNGSSNGTAIVKIEDKKGANAVPEGRELVNIDFPELTDIKDIIKAVALWTGKNVILDRNVTGKVQIISPQKVTKEEAYQAFLSALNMLDLTTVETGKVIKIMKVRNAVKGNLKTFQGSEYAPRTDEIITQIIPLKYIDAKQVQRTLSRIVSTNSMIAYEPTNTLIVSESGHKIRRILDILELLDIQTQQPKVMIVPIKYSDPKSIADKVNEILRASAGKNQKKSSNPYNTFKILTDERSNSVIIFGPPRTIQDIKALVKKFDISVEDPSAQATIHVRPLDYADAKKLAATLSSLASNKGSSNKFSRSPIKQRIKNKSGGSSATSVADLGDGVKITADESSNSLLITGNRSSYEALNSIIRQLDVRRSQVYIEADILDITESDQVQVKTSIFAGNQLNNANILGTWEASGMAPLIASQAAASSGISSSASSIKSVADAFSSNFSIGILASQEITVPGLGSFQPGSLINMIKQDSNTRVLASPHILTSNNEEAQISVGEKVLFFSSTKSSTGEIGNQVQKEDVDMTLTIKPNISHSNYVTLNLELDSNSITGFKADLPQVSKRKTKQIVTARNGQTIVVSGLVKNSEVESFSKIPLLGDIPILGWLFRHSSTRKERSNLVIFITPHVVYGANDLAAIYKSKIKERDSFLKEIYGPDDLDSEFSKNLPSFEDGAYKPTQRELDEEKERNKRQTKLYEAMGYNPDKDEKQSSKKEEVEEDIHLPMPGNDFGDSSDSDIPVPESFEDNVEPSDDIAPQETPDSPPEMDNQETNEVEGE